jgi:hypothetical protein
MVGGLSMNFKSWTAMLGGGLLLLLAFSPAADSAAGQAACGDLNITYSPTVLSPPNHKLQTITITATDNDADGDNFLVQVDSITSSQNEGAGGGCCVAEGPDFTGVGNTASGSDPGTAVTSVQVRAERCGEEGDRVYDIKLSCSSTAQPGGCTPPQCSCSGSPPVCECVISCTTGGIADDQGTADLLVTVPHDHAGH